MTDQGTGASRSGETKPSRLTRSFELLPDGSLLLRLGEHCIQTAARIAHREVTSLLMDASHVEQVDDANTALEPVANTLALFLNNTDFPALRAEHPALAGGAPSLVRLRLTKDGEALWELVVPK
ncbi:MAG: hypothetical protein RBU30_14980 [Polyangia bacterium]|jgi:hypothetical protein|nr:hypothetical protein [Polyangia bacterium]